MVHGPEVSMKYQTVLQGRQMEMYPGASAEKREELADEVLKFADEIRRGTREELDEWYEIYRGSVYVTPRKKGIRG